MIDLHCHLLPGIDDGPQSLQQSIELCRAAVRDGITHAIATPHIYPGRWENTAISIEAELVALKTALAELRIPLQVGFAAEVRLTDQIMRQIECEEIPFYGEVDGYSVMLLEFPHGHIIPGSDQVVRWLMDRKIRPILAHPERNRHIMRNPAELEPFVEAGCWLQLTAASVTGAFGEKAFSLACGLLAADIVKVVASDSHNLTGRQPAMSGAYEFVSDRFGKHRARELMVLNPMDIAGVQLKQLPDVGGTRWSGAG
jgi:protein-tyrosine phosphatase